ncbi:MAG: hypothetical protein K2L25_04570 [Alphaproteobacteria bacterium]|nr:hypothetical protein [Alphaproteobacteria bacterium]
MKKIVTWIFAFAFTAPAAMADTPVISRAIPSSAASVDNSATRDNSTVSSARTTVRRDTAQKSSAGTTAASSEKGATAVRATRTTDTATRAVTPSRGAAARIAAGDTATSARDNLNAAVNTVGRNARVTAASVNSDPAVRRAGVTLRPSTAEVGGRAKIAGTNIQTGSNIGESVRALQSRAASSTTTTTQRETIAEAKERLEQTADLNKSCQEQYNDCMDQFCAVIDSNQKRCSCSANLSRYTKVETAVKDANTQLNEVAQRIRYVGLSADEIRAIMSATEAEEALSGARDTTETRNMLADIEDLIKNPSSSTSVAGNDSFSTLDLNLDFSDTSNLFSLDFLNNNSSSMSNLRGTDLYNAAKKRCNSILSQCKDAGATQQQLTANYDLAIDKDCIAYEQGLTKMNETLVSNVRSANLMLQKARLAVLQNKNQYDAKGCISALDTCMTDEMVCGENYEKCLDPTKRYIDENGKVVIGQDITFIRDFMKSYDNSAINTEFLRNAAASSKVVGIEACKKNISGESGENSAANGDGWCAVKYLLQKIGTGVRSTEGLCRPVLDKCQRYTYDSNNNYQPYNDIVLNYIQRAMVNIKSGQEKTIADYASNCMVDVATCYNQQVSQVNAWTSSASVGSIRNVMRGACRNVVLTCGYAIFDDCSTACEYFQDENRKNQCLANCPKTSGGEGDIIDAVSEMFYNSMLCPDNSTYNKTSKSAATEDNKKRYVNDLCTCNTGYEPWSSQCVLICPDNSDRNSYGSCVCDEGYTMKNGVCIQNAKSE